MLSQVYRRASDALKRPKSTFVTPFAKGDGIVPGDEDDGSRRTPQAEETATAAVQEETLLLPPELVPEEESERFAPASGSQRSDSTAQQEVRRLRESHASLERELWEKTERVAQLEAELRQQRAAVQGAAEAAEALKKQVQELEAKAGPERFRCLVCGRLEVESAPTRPPPPAGRQNRRNHFTKNVQITDSSEVHPVEPEGELKRESRNRTDTGFLRMNFDNQRSQASGRVSFSAAQVCESISEAEGAGVSFINNLKKSRERVPTGFVSARDLAEMHAAEDAKERGNEASRPIGRKARGPTQSCHVLIDFKHRAHAVRDPNDNSPSSPGGSDGIVLVPPPALRRGSTEGNLSLRHCAEPPRCRRQVQVAPQVPAPAPEPAPDREDSDDDLRDPSEKEEPGSGDFGPTSSTGSNAKRRVSFGVNFETVTVAVAADNESETESNRDTSAEAEDPHVMKSDGLMAKALDQNLAKADLKTASPQLEDTDTSKDPPSLDAPSTDRKESFRRARQRTSSCFVHPGALHEELQDGDALERQVSTDSSASGGSTDSQPEASPEIRARQRPDPLLDPTVAVPVEPESPAPSPTKVPASPLSPRLPTMGIKRRLDTFANDKRLEAFGTEPEACAGDIPLQPALLMEASAREEHLSCLRRYSSWRRRVHQHRRSNGSNGNSPYESTRDAREPTGSLIKGANTQQTICEGDVALLAEAAPLQLSSLGMSPEHIAHCFRGYWVEAGEELWREDAAIDRLCGWRGCQPGAVPWGAHASRRRPRTGPGCRGTTDPLSVAAHLHGQKKRRGLGH